VRVDGAGEGVIAAPLEVLAKAHPNQSLGSYPFYGPNGSLHLVVRGRDEAEVETTVGELLEALRDIGAKSLRRIDPADAA